MVTVGGVRTVRDKARRNGCARVRYRSSRPVLCGQTRLGRGGAGFTVYKFRTMVTEAEGLKAMLQPRSEHEGVLFQTGRDHRVVSVGARLRRCPRDELPQLINAVRSEMSLVGPSPPAPAEVTRYGYDARRRLVVKPGLTGLWQFSGRAVPQGRIRAVWICGTWKTGR